MNIDPLRLAQRFGDTRVLVVDDDAAMRKVVRTMLMSIGVRDIREASNGPIGLETIRTRDIDVVVLDWEMPGLDGTGFMRMLRSPATFPKPATPVIMLTGHGERSRVVEAVKVGVNEFLLKPVSCKALCDRLISVLYCPRPIMHAGDYYGPAPRKNAKLIHSEIDDAFANRVLLH
ncbi:MAG TPA: response regulator [Pseudolabrys sp.]|nr:response regulator [Pseudolabrys sp.]